MEKRRKKKLQNSEILLKYFYGSCEKKYWKKFQLFKRYFSHDFFLKEQQGVEKGRKECKWNLFIFRASKMFNLRVSPLDSWIMEGWKLWWSYSKSHAAFLQQKCGVAWNWLSTPKEQIFERFQMTIQLWIFSEILCYTLTSKVLKCLSTKR